MNKKIIIFVAVFVVMFLIISVVYIFATSGKNSSNNNQKATTYVDPGTGETVVTVSGKAPENTQGHDITMLGFDYLINNCGMTLEQVQKLESEFTGYSSTLKTPLSEISITLSSIKTTVDSSTGNIILKFTITLNRTSTAIAKVEYFGIDNPKLTIYNTKNVRLYKSR